MFRREGSSLLQASSTLERDATGNSFLDSLGVTSRSLLLPLLTLVEAPQGMIVAEQGLPLANALFPISSVISSVTRMIDGTDVEVTIVGRDGVYGAHLALGHDTSATVAMVQIADSMLCIPAADFTRCLKADAQLRQRVLDYVMVTLETTAQFSACNRLHPINERLARWLLMAHDRVDGGELLLTHDFLATMLGVRRPGVTVALSTLDRGGGIEYRRGQIRIANRVRLELASCECYQVANEAIERIMGFSIRKRI